MAPKKQEKKKHTKQSSLHDLDFKQTEDVITALENFSVKELSKLEIEDTIEIKPLGDAIKKTIKSLKKITEYKRQHPGEDVQAISFSAVGEEHYQRLGIEIQKSSPSMLTKTALQNHINREPKKGVVLRLFDEKDKITKTATTFNVTDIELFCGYLEDLEESMNHKSEASARILIDFYLSAVSRQIGLRGGVMFSFPELSLSQSTALVDPAKITYEELQEDGKELTYVTFLTGTTDYAFTSLGGRESVDMKANIQNLINLELLLSHIDGSWPFLLLEAKNRHLPLLRFIAQVIAEVLAVFFVSASVGQPRPLIPFCLSNGQSWVFGVVNCTYGPNQPFRLCKHTVPFQPKTPTDQIKVLNYLIFWATQSPNLLYKIL